MNVQHPDMIRQGVPNMHQGILSQPFFPGQPQPGQQSSGHNMGPFQNGQGSNPALGLMGGQPGAANPGYPLNMQQGQPQRRPGMFMSPPVTSGLNAGAAAGPPHMAGLAPGQMQSMPGFPAGSMHTIRRVQSQPHGMNQSGPHMSGMQAGMMGGGMVGMGVNGVPNMSGIRPPMTAAQQQQQQQQQQFHLQMRQQQAQQQAHGGAISPEIGLGMNRPTHMQGMGPMQQHVRTASGQGPLMPPSMPQHGMQQMPPGAFANPMAIPHQHQRAPGQQQPNMPGAMGANQLAQQGAVNRSQMTPDNAMFSNFPNQPIQPPILSGVPGMPMNNSQFNVNFVPSSTPPNPGGDMPQRNPSMATAGPTTQGLITPAQALDKMNAGAENFPPSSYGMGQPPPSNGPPRPPSQHSPHAFPMSQSQPSIPPQQSPRQGERAAGQMPPPGMMQRPISQPQASHRQSPIPPNASRTPRVSQTPLPMNSGGMMPPSRAPPGPGQSPQGPAHQQPPSSAPPSAHPAQIAPRPPSATPSSSRPAPPPSAPTASASQTSSAPESSTAIQAAPPAPASAPAPAAPSAPASASASSTPARPPPIYPVGFGQAVCRILQLSGSLGVDHKDRLKQSYWNSVVSNFFTEKATMKLTLWKDNQQIEAKPFDIGYPILPRFFLVTSQSGVKTMTIGIDGARERIVNASHALVECASASWTFRYQNGYSITLRGPLTAEVIVQPHANPGQPPASGGVASYSLKLDRLQFDAFWHDKYVALDSIVGERIPESPRGLPPTPPGAANAQNEDPNRFDEARYLIDHAIVPAEPINAFGIPQATMRCLELAESVAQMSELIQFSQDSKLGPVDALARFADKIRAARAANRGLPLVGLDNVGPHHHVEGSSAFDGHGLNGINGTPPNMFTHNASSVAGPSHTSSIGDQSHNAPQADGVDAKSSKGASQASQPSGSTPAASAATPTSAPTPGGPTTPAMANASLKRKAPPGGSGQDSPTTANAEQQPAKRTARKRGKTQGS